MQTLADIQEILGFYAGAGVDEAIGNEPVNRFDLVEREAERAAPPSPAAAHQRPSAGRPLPAAAPTAAAQPKIASNTELIQKAASLAAACNTLEELHAAIAGFEDCALRKTAMNTVLGLGNKDADLMIIDRVPTSDEDRTGRPMAGASGDMLRKMLAAIGIDVETTYIASALPWRPPGGRRANLEEQAVCRPLIKRYMELVAPRTLILFGDAAPYLLEEKRAINKLRGQWTDLEFGKGPVRALPMLHPSFLIEYPASKKMAWQDLLKLKAEMST
ncbi:uracil-DNA glycosylase [Sneathiella chinensis]|uniref:Type-4 uracil-DNA glycosylase n=1 Tax=Sneathiella chinensis TaxID=349750 RepID=A0ABQ5U2R6_9PROT|nr:uracil-DNA glycosylase [Sneathiella chinensis]GLQ05706.1 uracil-DNA glycosylase [Sneathiella chinensis]